VELKAIPERGAPSRLRLWLGGQEVGRVEERWVTSDVGATRKGGLYRLHPLGVSFAAGAALPRVARRRRARLPLCDGVPSSP